MAEWMIRTGDMLSTLSVEWLVVVALLAAVAGISALLWMRALINRVIDWMGCEEVYDAEWMDAAAWEETERGRANTVRPYEKERRRVRLFPEGGKRSGASFY